MKRGWFWTGIVLLSAGALLVREHTVNACGPFFWQARFTAPRWADTAPADFWKGNLGILRGNLSRADLTVAWRHLNGLPVPGYASPPEASPDAGQGRAAWEEIRKVQLPEAPPINEYGPLANGWQEYLRIPPAAFQMAADTFRDRQRRFGTDAAALRNWLQGQETVFASTGGKPVLPGPVTSPPWLKADREYQRACALFYSEQFPAARQAFAAIAGDSRSPWQPWASYLQARCLLREATLTSKEEEQPPPEMLRQALALMETARRDGPPEHPVRQAAAAGCELIRLRLEPALVLAGLKEELVAKETAGFVHALRTVMTPLPSLREESLKRAEGSARLREFEDWLSLMREPAVAEPLLFPPEPAEEAFAAALARWRQQSADAWLVAALVNARPGDARNEPLLAAAVKLPASSPAYRTVQWHGWRLRDMTRAELKAALREPLPAWAENELRARYAALAPSLSDWAADSLRQPVWLLENMSRQVAPRAVLFRAESVPSQLWPEAEAAILNAGLSLAQLTELTGRTQWPAELGRELTRAVWLRAILLERWPEARLLSVRLEPPLMDEAQAALAEEEPLARRFALARLVLRWPGLRPLVNPGNGLFRGYGTSPAEFDILRDNWWCAGREFDAYRKNWLEQYAGSALPAGAAGPARPAFQTEADRAAAQTEYELLRKVPAAQVWCGETVLAFAAARPEDPAVAEALHRVVKATRSPQCDSPEIGAISKRCFQLLHRRYPSTSWARQTPYHF